MKFTQSYINNYLFKYGNIYPEIAQVYGYIEPSEERRAYSHPSERYIYFSTGIVKILTFLEAKATLAHELAHLLLDHQGSTPERELEADLVAVKLGAKPEAIISGLIKIEKSYEDCNFYCNSNTHPSVVIRAINLRVDIWSML